MKYMLLLWAVYETVCGTCVLREKYTVLVDFAFIAVKIRCVAYIFSCYKGIKCAN